MNFLEQRNNGEYPHGTVQTEYLPPGVRSVSYWRLEHPKWDGRNNDDSKVGVFRMDTSIAAMRAYNTDPNSSPYMVDLGLKAPS